MQCDKDSVGHILNGWYAPVVRDLQIRDWLSIPSGKHTKSCWKWPIYSGFIQFIHLKWWFSMVTLVYQGNLFKVDPQYWSYGFVWELLTHAIHLLIIVCMQIAILDKPILYHPISINHHKPWIYEGLTNWSIKSARIPAHTDWSLEVSLSTGINDCSS